MADSSSGSRSHDRGREASKPTQVPARGWRDVVIRVKNEIGSDTLSLVAAGVAFYAFLSIFPAITALISIYGLVADPNQVTQQVGAMKGSVPPSSMHFIQQKISSIAQGGGSALGIGLAISLAIAIYSASKGVSAMITALNVAYDEDEKRGFIKLKAVTLLFTVTSVLFMLVILAVISLPAYLGQLGLPSWLNIIIRVARWIIMLVLMMFALGATYALAPSRSRPQASWASPGAIIATLLWLAASIAFSFYLGHFGSYNKTYGSAAAIVILMTWFWLSTFVVLIGAEINAELEGQTRQDTTGGKRADPRGERNATAADNVRGAP